MFTTQLNSMLDSGAIANNAIIRIKNFAVNQIQNRG
jgi:hypothetical protein